MATLNVFCRHNFAAAAAYRRFHLEHFEVDERLQTVACRLECEAARIGQVADCEVVGCVEA